VNYDRVSRRGGSCLPPVIQNPVAPHCKGEMREGVPAGSVQMLKFAFLTSGAQLPFCMAKI
jgi:hypothetical protein